MIFKNKSVLQMNSNRIYFSSQKSLSPTPTSDPWSLKEKRVYRTRGRKQRPHCQSPGSTSSRAPPFPRASPFPRACFAPLIQFLAIFLLLRSMGPRNGVLKVTRTRRKLRKQRLQDSTLPIPEQLLSVSGSLGFPLC